MNNNINNNINNDKNIHLITHFSLCYNKNEFTKGINTENILKSVKKIIPKKTETSKINTNYEIKFNETTINICKGTILNTRNISKIKLLSIKYKLKFQKNNNKLNKNFY